ncbi:unnamed protein product, partial [marine sediment metagenome]
VSVTAGSGIVGVQGSEILALQILDVGVGLLGKITFGNDGVDQSIRLGQQTSALDGGTPDDLSIATKKYVDDNAFTDTALASYEAAGAISLTAAAASNISFEVDDTGQIDLLAGASSFSISESAGLDITVADGTQIQLNVDSTGQMDFIAGDAEISISESSGVRVAQDTSEIEVSSMSGVSLRDNVQIDIDASGDTAGTVLLTSGATADIAITAGGVVDINKPSFQEPPIFPSYTVAGVPSASTYDNGVIIV